MPDVARRDHEDYVFGHIRRVVADTLEVAGDQDQVERGLDRARVLRHMTDERAKLALALFDGTRSRHRLGSREREWLEYGALLHDIGTHIGYQSHHKHSYYLICHGGLRGFEPDEVSRIGLVARYHRQAIPKKSHPEFQALPRADRRTIRILGAMVRLAEGLDRSHSQVVTRLSVRGRGQRLTIRLRSKGDAELEVWAADRHAAALAEVFATEITFETGRRRSPRRRGSVTSNLHR